MTLKASSEFGKNLANYRQALRWSQQELSKETKLSQSAISQFEAGVRLPSMVSLQKLSAALHVPINTLLEANRTRETTVLLRDAIAAMCSQLEAEDLDLVLCLGRRLLRTKQVEA